MGRIKVARDDIESNLDSAEAPAKTDVLAPDEAKSFQEGAANQSAERRQFLKNSLGKAVSSSTEILQELVLSLYEGGKKIVGIGSGELAKVDLPSNKTVKADRSSELATGPMDTRDVSKPAVAQERPDGDRSAEGAVGDRSKDSGLGKLSKPEITTDQMGRLTEYKLPDGTKYEIAYGLLLTPTEVTVTPEG